MDNYWGEVRPVYGRWVWPFTRMEDGDYFHVDHCVREPEGLRKYVSVRAAQLGKRFSVCAHDPEKPGYARVEQVPWDAPGKTKMQADVVLYGDAKAKIAQCYGVDLDAAPHHLIFEGQECDWMQRQLEDPKVERIVFDIAHRRCGAILMKDRIHFVPLPKIATVSSWIRDELAAIME